MRAHPFTVWLGRGWPALVCLALYAIAAAAGSANDDQQSENRKKNVKVLNKSPWVIGLWGVAGAYTGNPGMDAAAREAHRKAREDLEKREKTDTSLAGATIYERSQDLRRLEKTEGGNPATVKRTAPLAVRWISAASMLEALREAKRPSGQGKTGDLEVLFTLARRFHIIAIGEGEFVASGSPIVIKPIDDPEMAGEARSQAYLALPDGRKITPAVVELFSLGIFQPTPIFLFQRTVNGEPTIGSDVKTITFHFDKLDVKFNVSKMTSDGKPDL